MGKKVSWKGKKHFAAYKSQGLYTKNKKLKLARHLKNFPNDEQAKKALEVVGSSKPRTKPVRKTARWNPFMPVNEEGKMDLTKIGTIKTGPYPDGSTDVMFIQVSPTLNLMSGRISLHGKQVQILNRESKAIKNVIANDPKGKLMPKAPVMATTLQPSFATQEDKKRFMEDYKIKERTERKRKQK